MDPPISAFIDEIRGIMCGVNFDIIKNDIIVKGPSFCQVDKIKHEIQDIDDITLGNHEWHGAIPSFRRMARVRIRIVPYWNFDHIIDEDKIIILDPSACARKYLVMASVSWNLFEDIIRGMKLNRLISMAHHNINQFWEEIIIRVLVISVDIRSEWNGDIQNVIKI